MHSDGKTVKTAYEYGEFSRKVVDLKHYDKNITSKFRNWVLNLFEPKDRVKFNLYKN